VEIEVLAKIPAQSVPACHETRNNFPRNKPLTSGARSMSKIVKDIKKEWHYMRRNQRLFSEETAERVRRKFIRLLYSKPYR
jgi:hypothetical protein